MLRVIRNYNKSKHSIITPGQASKKYVEAKLNIENSAQFTRTHPEFEEGDRVK